MVSPDWSVPPSIPVEQIATAPLLDPEVCTSIVQVLPRVSVMLEIVTVPPTPSTAIATLPDVADADNVNVGAVAFAVLTLASL
jgi:hypothetical protein